MSTTYPSACTDDQCSALANIREAIAASDAAMEHLAMMRRLERKRLETFVRLHPNMAVAEMARLIGRSRPTIDKVVKDVYR